jgi:hypothetical protein
VSFETEELYYPWWLCLGPWPWWPGVVRAKLAQARYRRHLRWRSMREELRHFLLSNFAIFKSWNMSLRKKSSI